VNFAQLDNFVNSLGQLSLDQAQITELLALATRLKGISPLTEQIELPGPTGERNFMLFAARGFVGCLADSLYEYCVQVIYALASGNQVILPKDGVADSLGRYLPNKSYFTSDLTKVELIHVLLVSKNYANLTNIKNELAKRDSLLTGVMQEADHGYNIHFLVTERTVSINITATGGNVQLMSIDDKI
jgi:RHH-type proline utilization regulon transcriptional repressor/proline dehydrogenase/delta 1-pyrroline-5-carboxylate dehydrogenase